MSQHRSLRAASTLGGKRNVLKRFERTEILKKRGHGKDGDRITGLRKNQADCLSVEALKRQSFSRFDGSTPNDLERSTSKILADAGVASRRAGEQIILEGRVMVNGAVIRLLGSKVDPEHDKVMVDGKPVSARHKIYLALNKPPKCVCSHNDELGRPTIYELLPPEWSVVNSVGRLDFNSEGLIFLTNDGQFALRLTHPRYGVRKKYLATVEGEVTREMLEKFRQGIFHEGEKLQALAARVISGSRAKSLVEIELGEGKNREVRRLFESQGLLVKKLQRTQIGKIKLGELKPGRWRTLNAVELNTFTTDL